MWTEPLLETGPEPWIKKGTVQTALKVVKSTINFSGVTGKYFIYGYFLLRVGPMCPSKLFLSIF